MSTETAIELFGYLGSFIVLISFLMVSVVKLRVVNAIGSFIFFIYALIIKSYPTAIMNLCLILINLHYLWKMSRYEATYDLIEVQQSDSFLKYELETYKDDILTFYPEAELASSEINKGYIVCADKIPVGIVLGKVNGETLDLYVDYVTKEYRDFSIAKYVFSELPKKGIKKIRFCGNTEAEKEYLEKMQYVKTDEGYVKEL